MPVPSLPSETIIQSSLQSIPAAPALVALARFTYAPGSFFPPAAGAGPVVFHMEAGLLHFQAEGPVFLTRGPAGNAAGPVEVLPGTEFDVSPGDQLLVPGNTSHSVRCISANTAQILGFALFPQVPPQQFPPGIQFVPLVLGMASILPKVPLNVTLDRVSYPSNSLRSQSYSGPSLFYMESGAVYSMLGSGQGQIMRAGSGPSTPPEPAVPGSETLLTSGDGLLLQPGSSLAFRNPANGTAVVLEAITRSEAEANRALARRYFYDVWSGGDISTVGRLFSPDFMNHNLLPGQKPAQEGVRQFVNCWRNAFSDTSISVDLIVGEQQRIVARWTARGTHQRPFLGIQPSGKSVAISGITIFGIRGGSIAEAWSELNLVSLLPRKN